MRTSPPDATVARADTPSPATGTRFAPGAMLAGRYRIIALLARGGMGEVYRVDDTKPGSTGRAKFLPRFVLQDAKALDRLYCEVRLGRQVSHPNVCRLHDIGESEEGHRGRIVFDTSMEDFENRYVEVMVNPEHVTAARSC